MFAVKLVTGALFFASLVLLVTPHPFLSLLPVVGMVGILVLNRWPGLGLIAMATLVPLEGLFANNKLFTGAKFLGVSLLLIGVLQFVLRRKTERDLFCNLWRPLAIFLLCYILSFAFCSNLGVAFEHARQMLVGILLFLLVLIFWRDIDVNLLIRASVLGVAASCVVTLVMASRQAGGRAIGLMDDPNYFALLVAFAIPLGTLLVIRSKAALGSLFWLAVTGLLVVGMVKSDSRSGFVVAMLVILVMAWNYRRYLSYLQPRYFGWVVFFAGFGIATAAIVLPKTYIDRIQSLVLLKSGVKSYEDTSLGRRMSYLVVGADAIKDSPILGAGPGSFPIRYGHSKYASAFSTDINNPDLFRRAHNTYLELFAETGLAGGLSFVALIVAGLNNFWRARLTAIAANDSIAVDWATHIGLSFLAVAVFMLFLSIPNHKYLWMLLAISSVLRHRRDEAFNPSGEAA